MLAWGRAGRLLRSWGLSGGRGCIARRASCGSGRGGFLRGPLPGGQPCFGPRLVLGELLWHPDNSSLQATTVADHSPIC